LTNLSPADDSGSAHQSKQFANYSSGTERFGSRGTSCKMLIAIFGLRRWQLNVATITLEDLRVAGALDVRAKTKRGQEVSRA